MKNIFYLLTVMFIWLCVSCNKDTIPYNAEFNASKNAWNKYQISIGYNYSYISCRYDSWGIAPSYTQTKVTVKNGIVIGRAYEAHYLNPTGQLLNSYTEDKNTLDTHNVGSASITIDEIYTKAANEWLTADASKNKLVFDVDSRGIIASCGYSANDCVAYCFTGVNIKDITPL